MSLSTWVCLAAEHRESFSRSCRSVNEHRAIVAIHDRVNKRLCAFSEDIFIGCFVMEDVIEIHLQLFLHPLCDVAMRLFV